MKARRCLAVKKVRGHVLREPLQREKVALLFACFPMNLPIGPRHEVFSRKRRVSGSDEKVVMRAEIGCRALVELVNRKHWVCASEKPRLGIRLHAIQHFSEARPRTDARSR